ncbi:MAG: peroxidase family protein [Pseudomonadota bacterium]
MGSLRIPMPEGLVTRLAETMTRSGIKRSIQVPQGYTYIGQMISHDIVPNTNLTPSRNPTRFLNLDSLYGQPGDDLQDKLFDADGRFRLDAVPGAPGAADLHRPTGGIPQIPEQRNDENVIVRQLHVLWLQLHNKIVTNHLGAQSREQRIRFAQAFVVMLFQAMVTRDLLHRLCQPRVYDLYVSQGKRFLYANSHDFTKIPPVFSHAGFRFGHSMVRSRYNLQKDRASLPIEQLFLPATPLHKDHVIDWSLFFGDIPSGTLEAQAIDLDLAEGMGQVHFGNAPGNIAKINIQASQALPSGPSILACIKAQHPILYDAFQIATHYPTGMSLLGTALSDFTDEVAVDDMPLWLYVLLEARSNVETPFSRLGPVGSMIVLEVLSQAIDGAAITISADETQQAAWLGPLLGLYQATVATEDFGMETIINMVNHNSDDTGVSMSELASWVGKGITVGDSDIPDELEALRNYHPLPDGTFRVETKIREGGDSIQMSASVPPWTSGANNIMKSMKFKLKKADGVEYLEAKDSDVSLDGYRVHRWRIEKEMDVDGLTVFLDKIDWVNSETGKGARTRWRWARIQ